MKYRIAHVACTLLSVMDLAESQIRGAKENRELQNLDFMDQPPPVSAGKDCFKMNQQGRGPTCDPTPDPSFSPSLPPKLANEGLSTNPTTSPAPSKTFSGAPSQLPSDSPSEVPTELPSDSPSEVPTELPSDSPSEDPTASTSPSAVPTTSSQPSLSATPTLAPTLSSSPSLTASSSPSTVPTTSAAPTTSIQPSAENQLRFIADDDEVALPDHYLGKCEADCDSDSDCNYGLVCYQRELGETDVPGCVGDATLVNDGTDDFCIEPPADNSLLLFGDNGLPESSYPLGACQGECDEDDDCGVGLLCFERDDETTVPNCVGYGVWGFDYCYSPPTVVTFIGGQEKGYYEVELCQGDCDYDSDCSLGLVCYRRGYGDDGDIPGCDGDATKVGTGWEDYCIARPTSNTLNIAYDYEDDIGTYPIGLCSADCETDEDCAGSLTCFERDGEEPVPGCIGKGEEEYSYCI